MKLGSHLNGNEEETGSRRMRMKMNPEIQKNRNEEKLGTQKNENEEETRNPEKWE